MSTELSVETDHRNIFRTHGNEHKRRNNLLLKEVFSIQSAKLYLRGTLRVVGGDEKGSLESGTVKYGHESYGTRTRK
jgi:hypothetical protein